jgi:hypothetical protein
MKDIVAWILFYMVWNSPVHEAHPTAVPVLLTLYIICNLLELIDELIN